MSADLSVWDSDGLPDYETWLILITDLEMTGPEIDAWVGACKGEAWIREHLARYENAERNLAMARYFWRRVEKLREYSKRLTEELDAEEAMPQ